jgi:hypothetical protein
VTTPPQETTLPDEPEPGSEPETDPDLEAEDPEELDPDEPPSGPWIDTEDLIDDVTEQEAEEGKTMGERIDTGDDLDGGG